MVAWWWLPIIFVLTILFIASLPEIFLIPIIWMWKIQNPDLFGDADDDGVTSQYADIEKPKVVKIFDKDTQSTED